MNTRARRFLTTVGAIAGLSACADNGAGEGEPEVGGESAEIELTDRVSIAAEGLASLNLTFARAERVEISPSLEVPAELVPAPDRMASVGSRVAGRVVSVQVNTGDRVTQGQPLVVIESAEVGRAWADLIAARASESVASQALERQRRLS